MKRISKKWLVGTAAVGLMGLVGDVSATVLQQWEFNDAAGTALSNAVNSVPGGSNWVPESPLPISEMATDGSGDLVFGATDITSNGHFPFSPVPASGSLFVRIDFSEWDLSAAYDAGTQESIQFYMEGTNNVRMLLTHTAADVMNLQGWSVTGDGGTHLGGVKSFTALETNVSMTLELDLDAGEYRLWWKEGDGYWTSSATGINPSPLYLDHLRIRKFGPYSDAGDSVKIDQIIIADQFDDVMTLPPEPPVPSDTVLIDFGNDSSYRGLSVVNPDHNGNYWNSVHSGAYYANMVDTANVPTTIDFGFSTAGGSDSYNGPAGATSTDTNSANYYVTKAASSTFDAVALGDLGATNAVFDYYVGTNTFTIQGLDPEKTYTLTFYASHKYSDAFSGLSTYTVYTSNDYSTVVASNSLAHNDEPISGPTDAWKHNQDRTVSIVDVAPQHANSIWVRSVGYINALKVEPYIAPVDAVLVDFGNDTSYKGASTPSPDDNGNHWNSVKPSASFANVVDTNGNATTIGLVLGPHGTDSFNGPAGGTASGDDWVNAVIDEGALGDLGVKQAAFDFIVGTNGAARGRFEIQGLDPAKLYTLTFYGSHKYNSDNTTTYSIYSDGGYTNLIDSAALTVGVGSAHNQDTVAIIAGLSPQASNALYVEFGGGGGANGYLNAMKIIGEVPAMTYSVWAADYPTMTGGEQDDSDNDGLINLYEYALGGNPTNGFVDGEIPTFTNVGGSFEYLHARRSDDTTLSYYLEVTDNLVLGIWTNAGYSVVGEDVTGGTFDYVTNQVPADTAAKFIRLIIEN